MGKILATVRISLEVGSGEWGVGSGKRGEGDGVRGKGRGNNFREPVLMVLKR